ncbi:MAG: type II toxin-antitoxin system RelE/ParE family toxin [Bdellovibrio sp.]|nr:type II toxin-antitoxin system RelE/ParE family toxin [Bdellovibrio sp.]
MKKLNLLKCTEYGTLKLIIWHPATRETIRQFPDEVRMQIGYLLHLLQKGQDLQMPQSRPMSSISVGAHEIRTKDRSGIFRVFYFLKSKEGIYVFHAFQKKTQKTPHNQIHLAKKRLQQLLDQEK